MPIVLKSGNLNLLEPSGPLQTCNGIGFFCISPTRTVFYMPRPSYLQCILHSTCPDHHISNVYCILHDPFTTSVKRNIFYMPCLSQLPSVHTVMILILHILHSPLTSPFLRYKHSCQQFFSNFSLCAISRQTAISPSCRPAFCQQSDRQNLAT